MDIKNDNEGIPWIEVQIGSLDVVKQEVDFFDVNNGVMIYEVTKDSPAYKSGLKAGDIIVKVQTEDIYSIAQLKRIINYVLIYIK